MKLNFTSRVAEAVTAAKIEAERAAKERKVLFEQHLERAKLRVAEKLSHLGDGVLRHGTCRLTFSSITQHPVSDDSVALKAPTTTTYYVPDHFALEETRAALKDWLLAEGFASVTFEKEKESEQVQAVILLVWTVDYPA